MMQSLSLLIGQSAIFSTHSNCQVTYTELHISVVGRRRIELPFFFFTVSTYVFIPECYLLPGRYHEVKGRFGCNLIHK